MDEVFYGQTPQALSRFEIVEDVTKYLQEREVENPYVKAMCRHIMGLFTGQYGARVWRRTISEQLAAGDKPSMAVQKAANAMREIGVAA